MSANTPTPPNAAQPPKAVIRALKKLLRPLVRLLLSFQITLPYLIELLKSTYVEIADRDFKLENKKQTDARISLLTGVHRKDTRRLRNQETEDEEISAAGVGSQLVANWISQPEYLDKDGEPRRLALKAKTDDPLPDFEQLVQSVCKQDMRARVVLDEWQRLGMATLVDGHWVELNKKAFLPDSGIDEKAFFLGMNVSDHLEAASQNLLANQPPFVERCVYYDGLSEASIQELKALAEQQGMEMLQALNKKALELKEKDQQKSATETQRMNAGIYFFNQPQELDDERA